MMAQAYQMQFQQEVQQQMVQQYVQQQQQQQLLLLQQHFQSQMQQKQHGSESVVSQQLTDREVAEQPRIVAAADSISPPLPPSMPEFHAAPSGHLAAEAVVAAIPVVAGDSTESVSAPSAATAAPDSGTSATLMLAAPGAELPAFSAQESPAFDEQ